jgi:carotenoid cleavage dioxygenase-like enzyme
MGLNVEPAAVIAPNPYLEGPFAPVHEEVVAVDLEVLAGEIPRDLNGVYVRNGPNPQYAPAGRYHWFDGDGMLHAVYFAEGRATYRNRWVRTDGFVREREAGRALWRGIMEPFSLNPPDAPEKDTANTDVVFHRGRLLSLWYRCGRLYAVDPVTLETLGADDCSGTLSRPVSAHARADAHSGELMFFDYSMRPPYMHYGVLGADGTMRHLVPVELPGPRLPHDMAITERHSILMDLPLFNDPEAARRGRHKLRFDRSLPSRFGVIPRHGRSDEVRWFEAEPCYIYHSINAWEEGDVITLDVCRVVQPRPGSEREGPLAQMLSYLRLDAHLHRYRFNLRTGDTNEEELDDDNTEFPSISRLHTGRRARFAYTMHISAEPTLRFDGLTKVDLETGSTRTHWFGRGRWGSEAPFAPRDGSTREDDGYVVSFVHDENAAASEVVILDGAHIEAPPVARLRIPARVPLGFHATWVPGNRLAVSEA